MLLDRSVLRWATQDDPEAERRLLEQHFVAVAEDVAAIAAALPQDPRAAGRAAHRLRGASLSVGAPEVTEWATRLEMGAPTAPQEDLRALLDGLRAAIGLLREQVGLSVEP